MYRRCVIKPGEIAPALHLLLLKNGLAKLWSHGGHRTEAALSAQLLRINTNRGHLSSALVMSRHVSSFDFFVHICMTSTLRWTFCLPSCVTCFHCHSLPIWQKLRYQIDWSVISKVRHCAPSFKSSKRLQSFKSKLPAKRARTPATIKLLGFEKYSCLYTAVHPRWNRCFLGKSASTAIHKWIIGILQVWLDAVAILLYNCYAISISALPDSETLRRRMPLPMVAFSKSTVDMFSSKAVAFAFLAPKSSRCLA